MQIKGVKNDLESLKFEKEKLEIKNQELVDHQKKMQVEFNKRWYTIYICN